jgi:uncharacterized protein
MADTFETTARLKTAVVTGSHPYEVPAFHDALRAMPDVLAYPQHMEDFATNAGGYRDRYDVIVFYNMHMTTPAGEGGWFEKGARDAIEALGTAAPGIVVLHHAILAYPEWPLWSEIVGIEDRSFGYHMNQTVLTQIANADHPITHGLAAWEMVDETYTMRDAGEGCEVLLTTGHPRSMKTLAWTRQYRDARVFCYEAGHDGQAFSNPSFRTVLDRGIQWVARRL